MISGFQTNAFQNNSWQIESGAAPPVVVDVPASAGNIDWLKRKKKRGKVIRYSDFESQEAYAKALAAASLPIAIITEPEDYEEAFGDDDAILKALFLTTLH